VAEGNPTLVKVNVIDPVLAPLQGGMAQQGGVIGGNFPGFKLVGEHFVEQGSKNEAIARFHQGDPKRLGRSPLVTL
jgi:hypothetical protein